MIGSKGKNIDLEGLLKGLKCHSSMDLNGIRVKSVTADSRQVGPGALFVAVPGTVVDGHTFIQDALNKGCVAVVAEQGCKVGKMHRVPLIQVQDSREALGRISATFFGNPGGKMKVIGITGTNGKTTCTYLLESVIKAGGGNPGVIGTVNYRYAGKEIPSSMTTPEPVFLQGLLQEMLDAGVTHIIMEVSSHALDQKRHAGLLFDVALFTNLSRDHLDYHKDMKSYFTIKSQLFTEGLKKNGLAVICESTASQDHLNKAGNLDWGGLLIEKLKNSAGGKAAQNKRIMSCGLGRQDVHAGSFDFGLQGIEADVVFPGGIFHLHSALTGKFNLKNILGVVGIGVGLGIDATKIRKGLQEVDNIPGRLERIQVKTDCAVFVDYAHTPDALENVLKTLREMKPVRLIVVFGCGGERDRGKRPIMGKIAGELADIVLVTTDNPRKEEPRGILSAIETGLLESKLTRMRGEILLKGGKQGYDIVPCRRQAIGLAILYGRTGDAILIGGKGHENYQITARGTEFFDDRVEVRRHAAMIM